MDSSKRIKLRLDDLMWEKKVKQTQLLNMIHEKFGNVITQSTLSNLINGKNKNIPTETLAYIADILGVNDISELIIIEDVEE